MEYNAERKAVEVGYTGKMQDCGKQKDTKNSSELKTKTKASDPKAAKRILNQAAFRGSSTNPEYSGKYITLTKKKNKEGVEDNA